MHLDDIDLALLRALNKDGRLPAAELAAQANVSRGTETLRAFVFEKLQGIPGVRSTQTLTVVEEVVDRPSIVPGE